MPEAGVFTFSTMNLGDEMQSYAVLAHLDRVQSFLDRDRLADFQSAIETVCVFNSWFMIGDDRRRPAPSLRPLWFGFATWKESLYGDWIPYVKEESSRGPIGCRDLYTTELLMEAGIDACWTGCITLFLAQALPRPEGERRGVLFVDVPPEAEQFIPDDLVKRAERLTTFVESSIINRPLDRWAAVARIVDLVTRAELVVTRRLHVALPAASYGTPVVAVPDPDISFARRRFAGFETILPVVYLDRIESDLKKVDWHGLQPANIPDQLKQRYINLCQTLRALKLSGYSPQAMTSLDVIGRSCQRVINLAGIRTPSQVRLRLKDRVFELRVLSWSDSHIDVALRGFPGLSKFDFMVEVLPSESQSWMAWGPLRDLVSTGE